MSKLLRLMIVLVVLLGVGLTACHIGDTRESCTAEELVAPTNLAPNDTVNPVDSLMPHLTWSYPEGCDPDSFWVVVETGWSYSHHSFLAEVGGDERTVILGPYEPGTRYYWRVIPYSDSVEGEIAYGSFIIGPLCTEADRASYTAPRLVHPPDGQVITETVTLGDGPVISPWVTFAWENAMTCFPPEHFILQVAEDPDFRYGTILSSDSAYNTMSWRFWPGGTEWHDCQRWYWRVLIGDWLGTTEEGVDPYSSVYAVSGVRSFIINTTGALCVPDFGLILTPIPWFDLPLPADIPTATTLEAANCRSGPTTEYPVLDILIAGTQLPIQGRNRAGDSWLVEDANISQSCWVHGSMVEVIGDTSLVMIVDPEPPSIVLPTETSAPLPENCAQYNSNLCSSHPACEWVGGVCKNKP